MIKNLTQDGRLWPLTFFHSLVAVLVIWITIWTVSGIHIYVTDTSITRAASIMEIKANQPDDEKVPSKITFSTVSVKWAAGIITFIVFIIGVLTGFLVLKSMANLMSRSIENQGHGTDQAVSDLEQVAPVNYGLTVTPRELTNRPKESVDKPYHVLKVPRPENDVSVITN